MPKRTEAQKRTLKYYKLKSSRILKSGDLSFTTKAGHKYKLDKKGRRIEEYDKRKRKRKALR